MQILYKEGVNEVLHLRLMLILWLFWFLFSIQFNRNVRNKFPLSFDVFLSSFSMVENPPSHALEIHAKWTWLKYICHGFMRALTLEPFFRLDPLNSKATSKP